MVTAEYRWYKVPEQRVKTSLPYSYVKDPHGNRYWRQYMCRESNQQYDCIFSDVLIDKETPGIRFGHINVTQNDQKNITFRKSTIRKLPETLLDSFLQAERVNLTGLQIEEIEHFALTNGHIRELYLGCNVIRELPKVVFREMRYLSVLVLDRNNLSSLPEGMLYDTPNMIKLSIANNNLKHIDDNTFKKTKVLQFLTVSNNNLTHIDLSLIPSLFRVNVSYNRLQTLSVPVAVVILDASHNLINTVTGPNNEELAILFLQHNNLTDPTFIGQYSGLVDVDLSYNELEMITFDLFTKMYRLERLNLANNRLVALNFDPSPIRTLQILDVRQNQLVHVEGNQKQFDTLKQLYLDHNAIVTLKLSSNNTLERLTLSHNDWDCNNLDQLLQNVPETVIVDKVENCKPEYILKKNMCCKAIPKFAGQLGYSYSTANQWATNSRPEVSNPSSSNVQNSNRNSQWPRYRCRGSNLNYDCIFHNVQIDINSPGAYFGDENVGINTAKKITFKNSTMRKLTNELVNSFEQIELLDLTGLQIEKIATNAFTNGNNIRELYMGFNYIQKLPHAVFQHMGLLTTLVLDRNNLTSLQVNIFHKNPDLIRLSLTNNNLMFIDDNTFKYCTNLQHLTVYSNKLTNFDLSHIPSLTYGNVSYNRLTTLAIPVAVAELDASYNEINAVTGPRNGHLNYLLLRKNYLNTTEWLLRYPGLVELDLSYNELEKISYHDFSKTVQLQKLYLSNNRLVALDLGPSPIRTLQILDVGQNQLVHVEGNQKQFDTLKQLYLDHNAIVTLKLSSINTLERLTLSHNDWDCNNLDQLWQNVPETVIVGKDQNCKPEYILKKNLCCKISENLDPYLDRLQQYIREVDGVEKHIRTQGRCSVNKTITSIQNLINYKNQHGEGVQSNLQLLDEINQLYHNVNLLKMENQKFQQYVDSMDTEIDNNVRRYRVTKAENVNRIKNLRPVFEYLESRRTFKREQTLTRQSEADQKKQSCDNMEQENETLQKQLNAKKAKQIEIANELKTLAKAVKKLKEP